MRAGRLIAILTLLQLKVRMTAEELADELEVSMRTIYRDIEELGSAGIPIYADRGPGGGFQLVDGYRTKLTGLAVREAEAMFLIGRRDAATALGLREAAERAGQKVLAALPEPLRDEATRLGSRVHVDPVEWYRAAPSSEHLPALARAVLDQHVVRMTYESWTSTKERIVEPLGLVLKAGTWYLVAQRDGTPRIYKVASLRALTVEASTFVRPADFDLPRFWAEEIRRFETSLRPLTARLRVSPRGAARLATNGAYAVRAVEAAAPAGADGWRGVDVPIESLDQGASLVLALSPEAEVLEPLDLRALVRERAGSALGRHGGG